MFNHLIRLSVYPILAYTIISCNSGDAKPVVLAKADTVAARPDTPAAGNEEWQVDPSFKNFPLDFSDDAAVSRTHILTTGDFHEDEVSYEDTARSWYGIFRNSNGYYLDSTRITTKRVEDAVGDEEGQKTGWEVKTKNKDTSLLLIAGVDGLTKRVLKPIAIRKKEILPGESTSFTYNGVVYTLYATGDKKKESATSDYYLVSNYRLYIKATINGAGRTTMLVACRSFDDAMVEILFAGDLDGDNIPDLILNTSYHYNAIVPTLYLSKPTGDKQLLKVMGWHVSVGC